MRSWGVYGDFYASRDLLWLSLYTDLNVFAEHFVQTHTHTHTRSLECPFKCLDADDTDDYNAFGKGQHSGCWTRLW